MYSVFQCFTSYIISVVTCVCLAFNFATFCHCRDYFWAISCFLGVSYLLYLPHVCIYSLSLLQSLSVCLFNLPCDDQFVFLNQTLLNSVFLCVCVFVFSFSFALWGFLNPIFIKRSTYVSLVCWKSCFQPLFLPEPCQYILFCFLGDLFLSNFKQ